MTEEGVSPEYATKKPEPPYTVSHHAKYVEQGRRRGSPVYNDYDDTSDRWNGNESDVRRKKSGDRPRSDSRERYYSRRSRDRYYRRRRSRSRSESPGRRSYRDDRHDYSGRYRYRHSDSGSDGGGHRRNSRRRRHENEQQRMSVVEDPFAALRSKAAAASDPKEMARKMQEQQLQARQVVLQQQAISAVKAASRTQREVYIGNIIPGAVTESMLRELFRTTLTAAFPDKCQGGIDPVIQISLGPEQKFCFMEVLTPEMASACLDLTGKISLMGASLTVGRPTGYVDPEKALRAAVTAANALAKFQADGQKEALKSGEITAEELVKQSSPFICIDGVTTDEILQEEALYNEILEDLNPELERHGTLLRVLIPKEDESSFKGKALVQYLDAESASKARASIDGRFFDGRTLKATFIPAKDFVEAVCSDS